jgi:hypothetical protein
MTELCCGNPHRVHEVLLRDLRVRVWCGVSVYKTTGPCFEETVSSSNYIRLMLTSFSRQLTEEEKIYGYSRQLCATAHTAYF